MAIFPYYLTGFIDLRFVRAFRIFRIFRILKLIRYNEALNRFGTAAKIVREELILFLMVSLILIFISSAGIYYFENEAQPEVFQSVFHSTWWSIVTLTTVGYGDTYPITALGKLVAALTAICGIAVIAIPIGIISAGFTESLGSANSTEDL